jgi:hypothetical protein
MPRNNRNQQVQQNPTGKGQSKVASARTGQKAAGTRWGTLQDWRATSKTGENRTGCPGYAIRDGRQ